MSLTEQEIRAGVESLTQPIAVRDGQPVAWIRARSNAEPAIQSLAADLKRALPVTKVLGARADIDGALSPAYRKAFVREVGTCLKAAIDRQINAARVRSQEPDFALNVERQAHDAFAAERLRVFVGREITRSVFTRHTEGSARHPLVLYGVSGSGKSALIAKAAAEASVGSFRVVKRFVRANAASSNQRLLLFSRIEDSPQPVLLRCRRNGQTTPTVSLMRLGMRLAPSPSLWQGRACAPAAEQLRKPWTPSGLTSSFITKNAAFLGNWTRCDCK